MLLLIKVAMSVALVLYFLSFFTARRFFKTHIALASAAFAIDIAATIGMEFVRTSYSLAFSAYPGVLKFHTAVAVIALILFLVQLAFGIARMKKTHVFFASYLFLPIWTVAFLSGVYLLF